MNLIHNLNINGSGLIDLPQAQYDMRLGITVIGQAVDDNPETLDINEADTACRINEKYRQIEWIDRFSSRSLTQWKYF